jgi:hypothetical protein
MQVLQSRVVVARTIIIIIIIRRLAAITSRWLELPPS